MATRNPKLKQTKDFVKLIFTNSYNKNNKKMVII